jgi:hypothetical protein
MCRIDIDDARLFYARRYLLQATEASKSERNAKAELEGNIILQCGSDVQSFQMALNLCIRNNVHPNILQSLMLLAYRHSRYGTTNGGASGHQDDQHDQRLGEHADSQASADALCV